MRAWRYWLLLLVSTAAVCGTLGMVQLIVARFDWRIDLTPSRDFTLSDHSQRVLAGLQRDVDVTAFIRAGDQRNVDIEDLLARVALASPHFHYALIDINRNPAAAKQYSVDAYAGMAVESQDRRTYFSNPSEALLIAAILQVTRDTRRVIYFVRGHGEHSVESSDRRSGYSMARVALRNEHYDVRTFSLAEESAVPADAEVVVIAGARDDFLTAELIKLDTYFKGGGALLVLLDPYAAPSLCAFLGRYGVKTGDDVVVDSDNRLFAGDYLTLAVAGLSERHPVSARLRSSPLFSEACSVRFEGSAPANLRALEFLRTGASSWRTPDREVLRTGTATFVDGRDQHGPLSVGVSLLLTSAAAEAVQVGRIIVLGDSDFAGNFFLGYLGNKDLLVNAVNWLAGEEALVGERPHLRTPGVQQLFITAEQGRLAFLLAVVVQPGMVYLAGIAVYAYRRWKG